jgi:hypothetical protein
MVSWSSLEAAIQRGRKPSCEEILHALAESSTAAPPIVRRYLRSLLKGKIKRSGRPARTIKITLADEARVLSIDEIIDELVLQGDPSPMKAALEQWLVLERLGGGHHFAAATLLTYYRRGIKKLAPGEARLARRVDQIARQLDGPAAARLNGALAHVAKEMGSTPTIIERRVARGRRAMREVEKN